MDLRHYWHVKRQPEDPPLCCSAAVLPLLLHITRVLVPLIFTRKASYEGCSGQDTWNSRPAAAFMP